MTTKPPDRAGIEAFAADWYRRLDRHAPVEETAAMVAEDVEFHLPEGVVRGRDGFCAWYEGVIRLFFDEIHVLGEVAVTQRDGITRAAVTVNWQARRWRPPAPRSEWIGFDAFQDWEVGRDPATGRILIRRYAVTTLRPMPGSPPL